jgi:kinesin family protein 18/19
VFDPPEDNPIQRFSRSVVPQGKRVKDQAFMFDRVFDDNTTQNDVYESTTRGLLDSVLDGFNATVFAYGATGCGKTHTISWVRVNRGQTVANNMIQGNCSGTWHYLSDHAGIV